MGWTGCIDAQVIHATNYGATTDEPRRSSKVQKNPGESPLASVVVLDEAQVHRTEYQLYLRDMLCEHDDGTTLAQQKGITIVVVCGPNSKSLMQWCHKKGFQRVTYGREEVTGRMRYQVIARSLISREMRRHERVLAETTASTRVASAHNPTDRPGPTRARGEFVPPDYNVTWRLQVLEKGLCRLPWAVRWVTYAPLFGALLQPLAETVWRMVRLTFRMWMLCVPCPVHEGRPIRHLPRFYRHTHPWSTRECAFAFRSTRYSAFPTAPSDVRDYNATLWRYRWEQSSLNGVWIDVGVAQRGVATCACCHRQVLRINCYSRCKAPHCPHKGSPHCLTCEGSTWSGRYQSAEQCEAVFSDVFETGGCCKCCRVPRFDGSTPARAYMLESAGRGESNEKRLSCAGCRTTWPAWDRYYSMKYNLERNGENPERAIATDSWPADQRGEDLFPHSPFRFDWAGCIRSGTGAGS